MKEGNARLIEKEVVLMELIIFYSQDQISTLEEVALNLSFNQISFIPQIVPEIWNIAQSRDLAPLMSRYAHSLFLLDQKVWNSPFFSFAAGYAFGKHVSTTLLVLPGLKVPQEWPENAHIFEDVDTLVVYYNYEYKNYHHLLKQLWAKKELELRGKEVSSYALIEAVEEGDSLTLSLFLDAGYSPDFTNKKGVPLLCIAVRKNHPSVVRELVEAGASLDFQSRDRGNTPLMDAAAEGHEAMVSLLLEKGAGVDTVSKSGQTALILATGQGQVNICKLLLHAGADPGKPDLLGMSAFLYAGLFKNKELKSLYEGLETKS